MQPAWVRVDLGAMAIKGCSAFPKTPASQENNHQVVLCHIQDTRWRYLTPLHRCSRCILQPQPTGNCYFSLFLFIIRQDEALLTSTNLMKKKNTKKKAKSKRYLEETITGANDANDQALLANTPMEALSLQQNMKQADGELVSTWNHIKQSSCVLIKMMPSQ